MKIQKVSILVLGVKCYYGEVFDDVPEQIAQLEEKECKNELGNCIKYEGMSKRSMYFSKYK